MKAQTCLMALLLAALLLPARPLRAQTAALKAASTNYEAVLAEPLFWEKGPEAFDAFFRDNAFRWTSERKESLRSAAAGGRFAGQPVIETVVWLKEGRPAEVTLSLYNRGDCPPIGEADFQALLRSTQKGLTDLAQVSASATAPWQGGYPPKRQGWKKGDLGIVMEWEGTQKSATLFQPEYLRVRLMSHRQVAAGGADRQVSAFATGQKKVTTNEKGDAWLADVPMVDQGPKGYCAVAATERVLRYYGTAFDQHQVAQIAGTEAGTDPNQLAKALQRVSTRMRITVTVFEEVSVQEILQLLRAYNGVAKKAGKRELVLPESGMIDVGALYDSMEAPVLVEARTRNPTAANKFMERIRQHVQARTPLVWGVMLGLVSEPNLPQARGGHLRLIIGYNEKTKEVLYTDSWGAGHELKRMTLADAYAITTSLFAIKPK